MTNVDNYRLYDALGDTHFKNNWLFQRRLPDSPLEPTFLAQPLDTKHQVFPTNDATNPHLYKNDHSGLIYPTFDPHKTFMPGTTIKAPWSGYIKNVDLETALQHRMFANQRFCEQAEYIPPIDSHLYKTNPPDIPQGRNAIFYAQLTDKPNEQIVTDTKHFWNSQSRLAFHEKYDFYPEFR